MRYEITHRTSYTYASDVSVSHHVARLAPRSLAFQQCFAHEMAVEPRAALITQRDDYYGNRATFFTVPSPHRSLVVTARSQVELLSRQIPSAASTPAWETVRDLFRRHDAAPRVPPAAAASSDPAARPVTF